MSVDKTTVARIAHLARLKVSEKELEAYTKGLNDMLAWEEQIQQIDTAGVSPMTSVISGTYLRLRPDQVTDGNMAADILANASEAEFGFFSVPKVVGDE